MGAAEAGFFPGMMYYLSLWFPAAYRARFAAMIMVGTPAAFVVGGPLSTLLLDMDGIAGFHGWQWLFVIEGAPVLLLAVGKPLHGGEGLVAIMGALGAESSQILRTV